MSRGIRAIVIVTAAAAAVALSTALVGAEPAVVDSPEGCLRIRQEPSLTSPVVECVVDGTTVEALSETAEADGYAWRKILVGDRQGWVAATFLQTVAMPSTGPSGFVRPPEGGLTAGVAGTDSVNALLAAQQFEVASLAVFDVDEQRFFTFIPGAPAHANTLDALEPDQVVLIRRAGEYRPGSVPVAAVQGVGGTAFALRTPDRGALTAGLAGTDDIDALIEAQPFSVESVSAWEVARQRWLVHIVGAPGVVNTLDGSLSAEMPVFVRRSGGEPASQRAVAAPKETPGAVERITYYFCERGANPAGWGDGGGFCGYMRSGARVYAGAASCAPEFFGTTFRIEGDPTERVYTCEDTGGGVGSGHRDIWFQDSDEAYSWWRELGTTARVILVE